MNEKRILDLINYYSLKKRFEEVTSVVCQTNLLPSKLYKSMFTSSVKPKIGTRKY